MKQSGKVKRLFAVRGSTSEAERAQLRSWAEKGESDIGLSPGAMLNFTEGMRVEIDDGDGAPRMRNSDRLKFFALGFLSSWALTALVVLIALMVGCGALPEPGESHAGRAWCCEGSDADGQDILVCGVRHDSPEEGCECRGIVLGDLCMDPTVWRRGSVCTEQDLVCW